VIDKRHSRGVPEVPRQAAHGPLAEPTQLLKILPKTVLAPPPSRAVPPPPVAARAVIVYEPEVRRPWRLWVFTLGIVALTVGVILGQAVAYEPDTRSSSNAQAGTVPAETTVPGPVEQVLPTVGQPASLPIGTAKSRTLSITGASTLLRIRSADLGDKLLSVTATDASTAPKLTDGPQGPSLELAATGSAGAAGAEIQLNQKVNWTIKTIGGSNVQDIDMRGGGLAGLQFLGGATQVVLTLPKPKATVPLWITEPISTLTMHTVAATPVQLRLAGGADSVIVNGKAQQTVKPGTKVTPTKWATTKARYDVAASAVVNVITVDRL
jgi:hypothetical protein